MLDDFKWPKPGRVSLQKLLEIRNFVVESETPVTYCQSPAGDTFGLSFKGKRTWHYTTTLAEVPAADIPSELKTTLEGEATRREFFTGMGVLSSGEAYRHTRYQSRVAGSLAMWGAQKEKVLEGLQEAFPRWEWDPTTVEGINRAFHFAVRIAPGDHVYPVRMTLSKRTSVKDRPRLYKPISQSSYTKNASLHKPILDSCIDFLEGFQEIADLLREDEE